MTGWVAGYTASAVAFGALTLLTLLAPLAGSSRNWYLPAALSFQALWGAGLALQLSGSHLGAGGVYLTEWTRSGLWLALVLHLLGPSRERDPIGWLKRGGYLIAFALPALALLGLLGVPAFAGWSGDYFVLGSLAVSIAALVAVEQLYRNALPEQATAIRFLCLAVGMLFAFDLFVYSDAQLFGRINPMLWDLRGWVALAAAPVMLVALLKNRGWTGEHIFVSRQAAFYGVSLLALGAYLAAMALGGYLIRLYGAEWGAPLQIAFFGAAVLLLVVIMFSWQIRRRIRVFLSKHFYRNRYDYRSEWLRLIGTLTAGDDDLPLEQRSIKALADILDCPAGVLWRETGRGGVYRPAAAWNAALPERVATPETPLVAFLRRSQWIVDSEQYREDPSAYDNAELALGEIVEPPCFVIPLLHGDETIGFVALARNERSAGRLNYEDHDLLKTAGRQVAGYLMQERAMQQLAESRQFEAFNKFSAFVMHDLKNLIAQQTLVVENAARHKSNPAFVDDAIETIDNSVRRMARLVRSFQRGDASAATQRVLVVKFCQEAVNRTLDRSPPPQLVNSAEDAGRLIIRVDYERAVSVLVHLIRNAQDACGPGDEVVVRFSGDEHQVCLCVEDTGAGMSEEFVRERLFRPFYSTKGAQGMGIGAYQGREFVLQAGGEVEVESAPGEGTKFRLRFPRCRSETGDAGESGRMRALDAGR